MWTGKGPVTKQSHHMHTVFKFVKNLSLSSRSAAVDSTGREINRNRLIALMAAIVLEEVRLLILAISDLSLFFYNP